MLRSTVRIVCLLALPLAASLALAQEFSADIVNLKESKMNMTKVYVGKDKVRVETGARPGSYGPGAFIIDEAQNRRIGLLTEQHMYIEAPPTMTAPIAQFWRVSDVNDACPQWKKAAEHMKTSNKFGTCTKIGSDSVDGRSAVKYQGTSTDGKTSYIWVDTKLHYVVKEEGDNRGLELRNIQEGTQPASLFEVPSGYTKFDMGGMMQQRQPK
jgi:hypothetical protein